MKDHSWLLAKKRGNHRTDSRFVGLAAEFAFAIFCVLAGLTGLIWLCLFFVLPEWRIHERYERTVCTLMDCRVSPRTAFDNRPLPEKNEAPSIFEDSEGNVFENDDAQNTDDPEAVDPLLEPDSSELLTDSDSEKKAEAEDSRSEKKKRLPRDLNELRANLQDIYYLPEMQLKYRAAGVKRTNWTSSFGSITRSTRFSTEESAREFLDRWQKEKKYYCLFNPEDPDQVVIMRDWQWENFLALIIPSSLLLIGVGIGIHALAGPRPGSKERTALRETARKVQEGELPPAGEFPYLPPIDDITDSPGIRLAYRLPMIDSPAWTLCVLAIVTLAWNAGCVLFLTVAACSFLQTVGDWLFLCYLLPFVLVGLWLITHTFIQFRNATALGPTLVEIEKFPLIPGQPVRIFLSQGGEQPILWLNVILLCEEEVVFTHGTNTRREKQRVYQRLIFGEESMEVTPEKEFQVEFPLEIPLGSMHSFAAPRNQLNWRILIQGKMENFPMFERSFPLIVYPALKEEEK